MTRTIIALEQNESLQRSLGEIIDRAARDLPALRWVDPAGMHLTLAFLGDLEDVQVASAIEAAEKAAQHIPPFEYRLKGLGIFGSPQQPRVLWMGIEDLPNAQLHGSSLQQLHRALNRELERRDFPVEKRSFSPHLTLARVKQALSPEEQRSLQRLLRTKVISTELYPVRSLDVMKSELFRSGAKYTRLQACPLGG